MTDPDTFVAGLRARRGAWAATLQGMSLLLLLAARPALAEDPPMATVVIEEDRLKVAWRAVVRAARGQGYHPFKRLDDATLFRSETDWKPDLVLYDDGRMEWRRQPPMLVTPKELIEDGPVRAMARQIVSEGGARSEAVGPSDEVTSLYLSD
jgi:hypothetical protein